MSWKGVGDSIPSKKNLIRRVNLLKGRGQQLQEQQHLSDAWFQNLWEESGMLLKDCAARDKFNEPMGHWIPDCVNTFYRYVIEVDGKSHNRVIQKERDQVKDAYYIGAGYKVFRLKSLDYDGFRKLKVMIREIRDFKNARTPPPELQAVLEQKIVEMPQEPKVWSSYLDWGTSLTSIQLQNVFRFISSTTTKPGVARAAVNLQRRRSKRPLTEKEWKWVRSFYEYTPPGLHDGQTFLRQELPKKEIKFGGDSLRREAQSLSHKTGRSIRQCYFWLLNK